MTPRERYAVIGVFLLTVSFGVVFNLRQNGQQARTDAVLCGVVEEARADRAGELAAYREQPPITLAGQAQREASERALIRWTSRAERLGCNESR